MHTSLSVTNFTLEMLCCKAYLRRNIQFQFFFKHSKNYKKPHLELISAKYFTYINFPTFLAKKIYNAEMLYPMHSLALESIDFRWKKTQNRNWNYALYHHIIVAPEKKQSISPFIQHKNDVFHAATQGGGQAHEMKGKWKKHQVCDL